MPEHRFPPEFHPSNQEINQAVLQCARDSGSKLFLIGGYVRDALLRRQKALNDFDYTVLGGTTAVELGRRVAEALNGHYVLLDTANDTSRVVFDSGVQVDFAGCVGGTLSTDIQRRDLTVNALAWDPDRPDEIIDEVNGLRDLESKTIRAISAKTLEEDPLRLMRVFRFAVALDFDIDPATLNMVPPLAEKLDAVAPERISYELFAIMESARTAETIELMRQAGLLEVIFPEMRKMHRVPPNSYHHLALFDHSIEVLRQTERGFADMPEWARETFSDHLSHTLTRYGGTKLAALLHDVGKPDTWVVAEDGRHTFIGHDKLGAEMCSEIAKRLKWSTRVERFICDLVRWHLRPGALFHQGLPTDRAVHRFYRAVSDETPQLVLLALGDFRGTCGPGLQEGRELLENQLRELLERYAVFVEGRKQTPKLLDGSDVMTLLGLQPGPTVGQLLEELEEAQGLREVTNKREAEAFIKDRYREKYSK